MIKLPHKSVHQKWNEYYIPCEKTKITRTFRTKNRDAALQSKGHL